MTNLPAISKAVTIKKTFSGENAVSIDFQADKSFIWALLTNAAVYQRWNSRARSIDGTVTTGGEIQLESIPDRNRVSKISVKEFEADDKFVRGGAIAKRIYALKSIGNGLTNFSMNEKIAGPMVLWFATITTPFTKSFEHSPRDLKKETETISNTK